MIFLMIIFGGVVLAFILGGIMEHREKMLKIKMGKENETT